ncbi:MAG: response regulator [Chloroflexi bacterium]|nr:response regulator [Chloroflexota bacterium]
MATSDTGFRDDLRLSARPVFAVLAMVGAMVVLFTDPLAQGRVQLRQAMVGSLVIVLTLIAWRLEDHDLNTGRWLSIATVAGLLAIVSWHWGTVSLLPLAVLPTALAAALLNADAAFAVAFLQTSLIVLGVLTLPGGNVAVAASALVSNWVMFGVLRAMYTPVQDIASWAWRHFEHAQGLLDEARTHRLELGQALADLADANRLLTRLNITAHGLRQAADEARRAKEEFVANVSHELRTPLNMIIGFSEMILQAPETYGDQVPSVLLADLDVIHRNAQHLATLIDDVLDLSQIEAGQFALSKEPSEIHEIVETAVTAVSPLFDSKGLCLTSTVSDDLPLVLCDRTRIREVVLNLLSNAGRFTEQGGVEVSAWREGGDVIFSVSDTGPGISEDGLSKLFQPFQQVDGSIRRRYGGSGLGLNISKRLIDLHGGRIWVDSREGVGTTFSFRLPIGLSTELSPGYTRWLDSTWEFVERTHPPMAPDPVIAPRMIVMDPSQALQRLLTRYLDTIELVAVSSIEEAQVELEHTPSQALLINGSSVAHELEQIGSMTRLPRGIPIIICSVPGVARVSQDLGVSDVLVKPISREVLLETLERLGLKTGTVLIVDDEPDALQLFGRMLASAGRNYRVLLARDGDEAMNVLHEHHPDVILLDLVMPRTDGFQFLERRAQSPSWRDIPVIVTSARDPGGQPIISKALAVTCVGGLTARQLLTSIEVLGRTLFTAGQAADRARRSDPAD